VVQVLTQAEMEGRERGICVASFCLTCFVHPWLAADATLLPPNQTSRIVGTVALSFHPDTMQDCPTLKPPPGVAYLSNMAVDTRLRR
jgi:hypothetical protein